MVRGISVSQFSIGASRRAKLKSCEVFSLHPLAPSCCMSCWCYLEFNQKADTSCITAWRREEVVSLPLKVRPGNTWYRCYDESERVKGCEIQRKNAALFFTSQKSYIFLALLNKSLQLLTNFARLKIRGYFCLDVFFHSHIFIECCKSRASLKCDVGVFSAED